MAERLPGMNDAELEDLQGFGTEKLRNQPVVLLVGHVNFSSPAKMLAGTRTQYVERTVTLLTPPSSLAALVRYSQPRLRLSSAPSESRMLKSSMQMRL